MQLILRVTDKLQYISTSEDETILPAVYLYRIDIISSHYLEDIAELSLSKLSTLSS